MAIVWDFGGGGWDLVLGVWGIYILREKREDGGPDVLRSANMPDARTTAPQYCEAVPGGLVFKARRLLYHSTLGRE